MGYIETKIEQAPQLITENKAIAQAYQMALENIFKIRGTISSVQQSSMPTTPYFS